MVFVHIHYEDVWPSLRARIEKTLDIPFRLLVTASRPDVSIKRPETPYLNGFTLLTVENRGRDVRPFLKALEAAGEFDLGLKLHGKRSVHRPDGDAWRDWLVGELLPETGARPIVERMAADPRLALLAPSGSLHATARLLGPNAAVTQAVAARLEDGGAALPKTTPFFAAGTMFWFRRDAFDGLRSAAFDDLFAEEAGQIDGTAAHAFERLFAAIAEGAGSLAVPVDVALTSTLDTPRATIRAAVLASVDTDRTFNRKPDALTGFLVRRLPFVVSVFRGLPGPARRALKALMRRR
ncbi:rhamnan synthesis F family protein [Aureimonas mangrovi]|uniref:rhamnan synthesis F family protein n=1 Tax=Aureimonas mangrovi TaxID=2758041 RepID=UPI00163D7463